VLVVEDDAIIAWHLGTMLSRLGHEVCSTVGTEDAALTAALEQAPDIILMDVRLARGGDGVRAARAIRAVRRVAIVFCTAHAEDPAFLDRIAPFDLSAVLGKPVHEDLLKDALARLLEAAQRREPPA